MAGRKTKNRRRTLTPQAPPSRPNENIQVGGTQNQILLELNDVRLLCADKSLGESTIAHSRSASLHNNYFNGPYSL